jgi:hypothetical protein
MLGTRKNFPCVSGAREGVVGLDDRHVSHVLSRERSIGALDDCILVNFAADSVLLCDNEHDGFKVGVGVVTSRRSKTRHE